MITAPVPAIGKRTIEDLAIDGQKVLIRVDFNVPLNSQGAITDDTRIREALPTLYYLLDHGAKVILCSHLGRPNGQPDPHYSLKPVAKRLRELVGSDVQMAPDCIGSEVRTLVGNLRRGEILLLENLRFHAEEENNDPAFAQKLASLADVFVEDAFGAVHRAHASTVGIAALIPSAAGLLLAKEIYFLKKVLENPTKPFMAILGGSKVSDKIAMIDSLLGRVNALVVGGALAYTFLKAQGVLVGKSKVEDDKLDLVKQILRKVQDKHLQLFLPVDHVVVDELKPGAVTRTTLDRAIPEGKIGVDIGPKTISGIKTLLHKAKTIFWNGPMGIFEISPFAIGTLEIADALANVTNQGAMTIVGGGNSVAAVKEAGVARKLTHLSTGGGASLEFLEGRILPGIAALPDSP